MKKIIGYVRKSAGDIIIQDTINGDITSCNLSHELDNGDYIIVTILEDDKNE